MILGKSNYNIDYHKFRLKYATYEASRNFFWIASWFLRVNSQFLLLKMFQSPSTVHSRSWSEETYWISDFDGYFHLKFVFLSQRWMCSTSYSSWDIILVQYPMFQFRDPASLHKVTHACQVSSNCEGKAPS